MVRSERGRKGTWILTGVALLIVVIAVSATGCASNAQVDSNATITTAASGQVGAPSGAPGGTPGSAPTGAPGSLSTTTIPSTTEGADSTTTTDAPTTTTTLAGGSHADGIYLVGTDISSGLYHGTVKADQGHWEISSDANGDKFVASGDPTGPFYVKVTYGQYLTLGGVVIKKASTAAADPLATTDLTGGTYRVGYDIAAGWYNGTVNGSLGYWEISSDANGQTLVANDYPRGPFKLMVKSGQYLTLRGVTVSQ